MRQSLAAAFLVFLSLTASAGTITSISPASVRESSGEHFITVYGSDLGDRLVFDGPAGYFEVDVTAKFWDSVVGWVPEPVVNTAGTYSLSVVGPNGTSGPVSFRVRGYVLPLVLLLPEYLRAQPLTREGAYVRYDVFAIGGEDPEPKVWCDQESGSFFKMGQTRVTCFASNAYGERADGFFDVIVRDEEAPILSVPLEPIVVKATSIEGAIVEYKASATDDIYGEVFPECLPQSGALFPIGRTTVQCSATDFDLNVGHASFEVEVIGEREPYTLTIDVPEEIVVEAKSAAGTEVYYEVRVGGTEDPQPRVTCRPESGSLFPIGDTGVICDAIDAWGMRGTANFNVRVLDTGFPSIAELHASPDALLADGYVYPVEVLVRAFDELDPQPTCAIDWVTANEDIERGDHDEQKEYDWLITGPLTLELRAVRFTEQRVYTIWVACSDYFGNRTVSMTDVTVTGGRQSKANVVSGSGKRRSTRK